MILFKGRNKAKKNAEEISWEDLDKLASTTEIAVEKEPTESTLGTPFSDLTARITNLDKRLEKIDAQTSMLRAELEDVRKRQEEYDDNIKKLLAIYEVVSERYNPFREREAPTKPPIEKSYEKMEVTTREDIKDLEKLYEIIAAASTSALRALIEDMKSMGIDTTPVEKYLYES
jgi:archaellum component FlaC